MGIPLFEGAWMPVAEKNCDISILCGRRKNRWPRLRPLVGSQQAAAVLAIMPGIETRLRGAT